MSPVMLLLQMMPILVFFIAEAVFNNVRLSIILAIICAGALMGYSYHTTGKTDWTILLDVGLIVILGTISIILKNDLFFKVKPAIIDLSAIIFFMVLIFSPDNFLSGYFNHMMQDGVKIRPETVGLMKTMLGWMCIYITLHIAAVLYTAFYSSRKMWAFVSGPGFYLLFIPVMIGILIKTSKKRKLQAAVTKNGSRQIR